MNLNHLNLSVRDVPKLATLFEQHFDFEILQLGQVPNDTGPIRAGSHFAMLRGRDGFSLVLTEIVEDAFPAYPKDFHLGFMLDQPERVHAAHQALEQSGYDPGGIRQFAAMGRDWTAFYCAIGDGIDIEVNANIPA